MHQVLADGVAPVHVAPFPAVRVVLEIEMPLALVVDQAVGIVVPADAWREVELRSVLLLIERVRAGIVSPVRIWVKPCESVGQPV